MQEDKIVNYLQQLEFQNPCENEALDKRINAGSHETSGAEQDIGKIQRTMAFRSGSLTLAQKMR
ncbi:hypothetical protein HYALB_00005586 [Hymenoscyphus albidus]|uniref:Uncharacterized protein n=1 Tax=Hymenoscyphus albidus TaxID=595503 RepID=A0A9N9LJQ8_9HELO|nr:hypothetical protein HYALB_00005586 [Hymenoscyphus albidus]